MAIFSLSHGRVGRSTHAAGTAGAHAKYVTRPTAVSVVMGEHMPTEHHAAAAWLDQQESTDRKNARVIDKVMVALPLELTPEQRAALVQDSAQTVTKGRCAWMAGIHDRGKDAENPHAHIIIRDRDIESGKRAAGLSEMGSTDRLRELWETKVNAALERAGRSERVDRRTLEDQGVDRQAQIHVGPTAKAMAERGKQPESRPREVPKRDRSVRPVDYPQIDQGRTRLQRNAEIIDLNREREKRRQEQERKPEPEDRSRQQAEDLAKRQAEAEQAKKERREIELFKATLELAAERRLQELAQKHVRELKPFQATSQAEAVRQAAQVENQTGFAKLFSRAADRLNPARVQEREERQRQEEERRRQEAEESRRRALEETLQRQERERLELERQIIETQHQQLRDFQAQQAKIREQRAKAPQQIERQRTQERGGSGRERERSPRR